MNDSLEYYKQCIDTQQKVYAIVVIGVNDYIIMPTHITAITYVGADFMMGSSIQPKTKLDGTYSVTRVHETEEQCVQVLKEMRERVGLGEYSNYLLSLYKHKYPELWI